MGIDLGSLSVLVRRVVDWGRPQDMGKHGTIVTGLALGNGSSATPSQQSYRALVVDNTAQK